MTEGYRIDSWVTGSGFENLGSFGVNGGEPPKCRRG